MEKLYDFIVAGGGIAGAVFSKIMSEHGYSCLLLEKADKPYEKVCGGWIPYKAVKKLKELGFDADELLKRGGVCTAGVVVSKNGLSQTYNYSENEYGIGTKRVELQKLLLKTAECSGCDVRYLEAVRKIEVKNDFYIANGFTGKRFVAAVGANSSLCGDKLNLYSEQTFGISEIIEAETALKGDMVYFYYTGDSKEYFWEIPIGQNIWNIGYWSDKATGLKEKFQYHRSINVPSHFFDAKIIRKPEGGVCGSCDYRQRLGDSSIYGIGDFAGCNDKETGEGIYFAIMSAVSLADELLKRKEI